MDDRETKSTSTLMPGQEYYRNRITGGVFQAHPRLEGLDDLELMVADENGELQKKEAASAESKRRLNPTRTPEKKDYNNRTTAPRGPGRPTLTPTGDNDR